jgi:hypothetical protein
MEGLAGTDSESDGGQSLQSQQAGLEPQVARWQANWNNCCSQSWASGRRQTWCR